MNKSDSETIPCAINHGRTIEIIVCKYCNGEHVAPTGDDDTSFKKDGTGNCLSEYRCDDCGRTFLVRFSFTYKLMKLKYL